MLLPCGGAFRKLLLQAAQNTSNPAIAKTNKFFISKVVKMIVVGLEPKIDAQQILFRDRIGRTIVDAQIVWIAVINLRIKSAVMRKGE